MVMMMMCTPFPILFSPFLSSIHLSSINSVHTIVNSQLFGLDSEYIKVDEYLPNALLFCLLLLLGELENLAAAALRKRKDEEDAAAGANGELLFPLTPSG